MNQSHKHTQALVKHLVVGLLLLAVTLLIPQAVRAASAWGKNYRIESNKDWRTHVVTLGSDHQGKLFAVQMQENISATRPLETWFWSSTNQGKTWSAPVSINPAAKTGLIRPSIAVGSGGAINIVWEGQYNALSNNIWFTRSTDGGATWSANLDIIPEASRALNLVNPILVAGPGNRLSVVMRTYGSGVEKVYAVQSTDGGASWGELAQVPYPDGTTIYKIDNLNLKMDTGGVLYLVFDETTTDDTRTYFSRSIDGGATWDIVEPVTPDDRCRVVRYPSLVMGDAGVLYIAFVQENGPSCSNGGAEALQLGYIRSLDGGENWSLPARIGPLSLPGRVADQNISLEVLPHQSGWGDDELLLVWVDTNDAPAKRQLRAIHSVDGGAQWSEILSPSDAANAAGIHHYSVDTVVDQGKVVAVWLDQRVTNWIYPFTSVFTEQTVLDHQVFVPVLLR